MEEAEKKLNPSGNEQWAIHALNIHGTFFERVCQEVVLKAKDWNIVDTNYPVEYRGQFSNLDIWAARYYKGWFGDTDVRRITLPIECKKNNPDFVDWIFFPQPAHRTTEPWIQIFHANRAVQDRKPIYSHELRYMTHDLAIVDDARETKGNYLKIQRQQDKTKTSNDAITKAANQIAIAMQALVAHEITLLQANLQDPSTHFFPSEPAYDFHFFFPTIVTTANLFTCKFDNTDIDLSRGEIDLDKAQLTPCPYLLFNYALPTSLQLAPKDVNLNPANRESYIKLARLPIFVVHSQAFATFLLRLGNLLVVNSKEISLKLQPEAI